MEKVSVALFDFDGTLFNGHTLNGIVRYSITHRYRFSSLLGYLVRHSLLYPLRKCKLITNERFFASWGQDLAFIVGGLKQKEATRLFSWIAEEYVLGRLRPDIIDILRHHQNQGQMVALLSGTFSELLEIVGQRLGISYVVGTRLEMANGEYSGKIVSPFCFGINKVKSFKELVKASQLEIDFNNSFAYSDSISDIPLLEMVGNPVAAYPDKQLCHLALQRGWQLIRNNK